MSDVVLLSKFIVGTAAIAQAWWQTPSMDDATGDRPLLGGRGVLLIDEFARATGLDRRTADALVADCKVEGLWNLDGRVVGLFDDVLPTKRSCAPGGWMSGRTTTQRHRSYVGTDDPDSAGGEHKADGDSADWTMGWGDAEA